MSAYPWRCVCTATGSGEAAAQRHAKECPRFGWPNTNPYVDDFNAGTSRAIDANRADRLVADGLCEVCGVKRHDVHLRTCSGCRRARTQARRKSA